MLARWNERPVRAMGGTWACLNTDENDLIEKEWFIKQGIKRIVVLSLS